MNRALKLSCVLLLLACPALAQDGGTFEPPADPNAGWQLPTDPSPEDAPPPPPNPPRGEERYQTLELPPLEGDPIHPDGTRVTPAGPPVHPTTSAEEDRRMVEGHVREGAFLSGPGSLQFILHHTLLGALGGLATQGIANNFRFDLGSREAMLAGTLVGAGLGFGASAWWQFNHWIGRPVATFGIVNSIASGMFFTGLVDLTTNDPTLLAWTALLGAELGAWLTVTLGGGDMPLNKGLMIASGAGWATAYAALLLGVLHTSGSPVSRQGLVNTLLIAPGIGAGALALAAVRYDPTAGQLARANIFGAGVGGAVLLLSALVLGRFDIPTPYLLSMLSSAGAMAVVSVFWEESAERPNVALAGDQPRSRRYTSVWW